MNSEVLANYSFLPWMKQGLSRKVNLVDKQDGVASQLERGSIQVKMTIDVDAPNPDVTVTKDVQLIGPGDIIGIHSKSIVRVDPSPESDIMEPNYMPFVEFYEEDFPWRYTPAMPDTAIVNGKRHTPWMTLLVLEEGVEAEYNPNPGGTLPTVNVYDQANLPAGSTLWGFAHIHVSTNLFVESDIPGKLDMLRKENPDVINSRILCSRRLDANKEYRAYLVPTFKTGVLAGTNGDPSTVDALEFGWDPVANSGSSVVLPVYHQWTFTTTSAGDFEQLARRLTARVADSEVGTRKMDIRRVGPGMNDITDPNSMNAIDTQFYHIGGALRTSGTVPYTWETLPADRTAWETQMTAILNQSSSNQGAGGWSAAGPNWSGSSDPVVTPPLYGRWHSLQKELPGTHPWVQQVNLDPGNRAAAGLGASIVRKNQEEYVDRSWKQVGAVLAANQRLKAAVMAKEVSYSYYTRHFETLSDDVFMAATGRAQPRTLIDNATSTGQQSAKRRVQESHLPYASESVGMRKVTNRNSRIAKKVNTYVQSLTTGELEQGLLANLNDQSKPAVTTAEPKVNPIQFMDASAQLANFSTYVTSVQNGQSTNAALSVNNGSNGVTNYNAFQELQNYYTTVSNPTPNPQLDLTGVRAAIADKINPLHAIDARINHQVRQDGVSTPICKPVLAEPRFGDAMYEKLREISPDFIIPNIHKIQDETVSLLETNPEFIESFMVGLNHEMARELLWREYPTDQRGTYFTQFWNVKEHVHLNYPPQSPTVQDDIRPIAEWPQGTDLGHATHRHTNASSSNLVLLVRGELLRKYPNALIYARPADIRQDSQSNADPFSNIERGFHPTSTDRKYPIFRASVDPDITLFGFDLTADEAVGDYGNTTNYPDPQFPYTYPGGWYFVIQEREGDVRFGLDVSSGSPPLSQDWQDFTWEHLGVTNGNYIDPTGAITPVQAFDQPITKPDDGHKFITWGNNSGDNAYIFYQPPVRVAMHATRLLYGLI